MTLIEQARDGDVLAVDYVCNRLEQAEKLIAELEKALLKEARIYLYNDPGEGPPEYISEALASAKEFKNG